MMRSLYSGVSGLKTHQTKMDVIGNNISNVNTLAFKSSSVTFSEIMYQTTQNASGANAANGTGGRNAKQIGLGVSLGTTMTNIEGQGATQTTGRGLDVKIKGDSFFVVNDGTNNYFTRAGSFYFDGAGNLAMTSTGYNVMGWQVDPASGQIKKDSVSALRIMQASNLTSPPEATIQAVCTGVLDSNSKQVTSDDGYMMNLNFFDSKGYQYTAKMKVNEDSSGTKGAYNVSLSDVVDSNGKSVLGSVDKTQLFGAAYPGKVGKGTLLNGYTMDVADSVAPLPIDATISHYTLKNSAGQTIPDSDFYVEKATGKYVALNTNKSAYVKLNDKATDATELALIKSEEKRLQSLFGKYFSGSAGDVSINDASTFKDSTVFNQMVTAAGQMLTVSPNYKLQVTNAGADPKEYFFADSKGVKIADSTYYVKQDGTFTDSTGAALASDTERDKVEAILKKYTTGASATFNIEATSVATEPKNVKSGNTKIDVTGTKFYQTLNFDSGNGTFQNIGGANATTLSLSNLGGNFKDVSIDFSQVTNYNNGGTSTMGLDKGGLDGTSGAGKKLGAMNGVSIDTNGMIFGSYDNGNTVLLGQIAAQKFANASGLEKVGENCYATTLNSGDFDGIGIDVSADGGSMISGALEMSNVDLSSEFTEMITTQRGFQANSRIITTSDTLLEELINLKR
ncbi:MAG: flagellar hook-basal body complex protein [Lachnospiraceae bacterium]